MADKDQFTFEDEDDVPDTGVEKQEEPAVSDQARGEFFFDTGEKLSGDTLDEQMDAEDSEAAGEEFFFETEEEESDPEQFVLPVVEQTAIEESDADEPGADELEADKTLAPGEESLFGHEVNADFPAEEEEVDDPVDFLPEEQAPAGDGAKKRPLLLVLLLLVILAAGAYYFMEMGSSTPSVPTVQVPVEKPVKAVSVPPPPAVAPAVKTDPVKEQPVTVAVPPPPAPAPASESASESAPEAAKGEAKPVPVEKPATKVAIEAPKPVPAKADMPAPEPEPAPVAEQVPAELPKQAAKAPVVATPDKPAPAVAKPAAKPVPAVKAVVGGAYALDAGSYLMESNKQALIAKLQKLGYEPLVTPVEATLDMTRLRLGTFSQEEIEASLDFARSIEPGSYSMPAGDGYVIYAGTFLKTRNLKVVKERFLAEGIKVNEEPVEVVRTLSRIRFGTFATRADASAAASKVAGSGVQATVVKAK